jgi:ACS family tartrate transporter-like MFS transporter
VYVYLVAAGGGGGGGNRNAVNNFCSGGGGGGGGSVAMQTFKASDAGASHVIFQVPSNLILERVGARRWIARIMISWGVISASFAFVPSISAILQSLGFSFFDNAHTFYFMRFIFGAAEAGFAPGGLLYLTYWFTADERARWFSVFQTAIPLSLVVGGPISGFVLDTFDGSVGLGGWQWLFIIEGVPAVLVGFWALSHLTDKPIEAAWLEHDEGIALQARIDHERKSREAIRHYKLGEALTNPRVLGLSLVLFGINCGGYGLVYWLPQIVQGVATETGRISASRSQPCSTSARIGAMSAMGSIWPWPASSRRCRSAGPNSMRAAGIS